MADSDKLDDAKELFDLCTEHEAPNRREALDDLRFSRLDEQWPERVKREREKQGRPCFTFNVMPAFIKQVVNDARQNQPSISVHPADSTAGPKTAEIYNGLIRNIETTSRADVAYDTALDFAVSMGFGYFRVNTEYAHDDSFDLDIVIKRIANPFSVYADPYSTESDSSDWNSCFVTELMDKKEFKKKYKGAEPADWVTDTYDNLKDPWMQDDRILLAEYFTREECPKTILFMSDQSVVAEDVYAEQKDSYDAAGISVVGQRVARSYCVTQQIMTGAEILETNEWAGKFIPIIPVYGEEINVEGRRHFRSLIRAAKDAQRLRNMWRTASTELVALAPKAPFIGKKGAFTTDAAKWATANVENHPFIEYDGELPPQRQPFAGVPAGAITEAEAASNDMKAIIGLYNASLGDDGNEKSGRAILARQREGDVSTFHFIDNLSRAIEHCGRILIDLIPTVYTAPRMIRVLGPEGIPSNVPLSNVAGGTVNPVQSQGPNGEVLSHVYDLSRGKYDLTVETGPSFTTRREEAANQMIEVIRAFPQSAPIIAPLLAKNLDWPGADQIAQALSAVQQNAGAQKDAKPGAAPDPMAGAKLTLDAAELQQTSQIEMRRLAMEEFRAQTERLKVESEARQHAMSTLTGAG